MPDEVKASHILISYKGADRADSNITRSKEEAKKEAERIRGLIINDNKDFGDMARKNSDGPSKTKGGDLGKFKFEVMAKEFSEAAFALDVGSVSEVVETGFGFHVIKRTE
jgi:parvulin-like peptidyl-prolyl isomerase